MFEMLSWFASYAFIGYELHCIEGMEKTPIPNVLFDVVNAVNRYRPYNMDQFEPVHNETVLVFAKHG